MRRVAVGAASFYNLRPIATGLPRVPEGGLGFSEWDMRKQQRWESKVMLPFARSGLALALLVALTAAVQAAPKPVEQLYAECHKRIVTPKGKFKEGDPKTDEAVEACVRKKLGPAAKAAPQEQ